METISGDARRELVRAVGDRYRASGRDEKQRILDEFVAVTRWHRKRWHRKHAIRVLNVAGADGEPRRNPRVRVYDDAVRQALLTLWEASDRICAKRLRPLLPVLITALERHGHLRIDEGVRARVLGASAATIDRLLAEPRAAARGRVPRRAGARPSIRHGVAVRTFADWKDPVPGSMEADLVAHCGNTVEGSFVHTLVLTDVATTWTECVSIVVREGTLIVEALDRLRDTMPFPLRALDTGPAYVAKALVRYLETHGLTHTRGAPYHPMTQGKIERYHRSMKNVVKLEQYYSPWELERAIARFVEHYNERRLHESLQNVTPADVYYGRRPAILSRRERIKRETLARRKRMNQRAA